VNSGARVWFDVSYTRTQAGNIGITRTVRRLFEEMHALARASGTVCEPVAFHSAGFRQVAHPAALPREDAPPASAGGRMFRLLSGPTGRRLISVGQSLLPAALLRWIWSISSRWTFNALSRDAAKVSFTPGDVLFIADASWKYPAWTAARRARLQGAKVVLLVYDLMPIRRPEFCFALVPLLFGNWLRRMIVCSDAVLCISQATAADLLSWVQEEGLGRRALPPTAHFRLGCDTQPPGAAVARADLTRFLGGDAACFSAVGSIEPKKNYAFLLEVFEKLWSRGFDFRLVIAGRPTPECESLVRRLRAHPEQRHRLLTVLDATDAEVAQLYARSRALIFPSLMEGFGLPLVEARTLGCPVIASDLPVFLELADEGVSFFDRTSEQALDALVIEHAARDRRKMVRPQPPFSWRDSALQCDSIMQQLLRSKLSPL
jgi:glycosyltransferase involved in cell wall biosynthesis